MLRSDIIPKDLQNCRFNNTETVEIYFAINLSDKYWHQAKQKQASLEVKNNIFYQQQHFKTQLEMLIFYFLAIINQL